MSAVMQSCDHPAANLKPEEVNVSGAGHLTVSFSCIRCLARITKAFLGRTPAPAGNPRKDNSFLPASELPLMTGSSPFGQR